MTAGIAESSHLEPQGGREGTLGMVWAFETFKSSISDTPLPNEVIPAYPSQTVHQLGTKSSVILA